MAAAGGGDLGDVQGSTAYFIKPEAGGSGMRMDPSKWPLLLKNYDALNVRTGHYTPIPQGCSPLKRALIEYIRCAAAMPAWRRRRLRWGEGAANCLGPQVWCHQP